MYNGDRRSWNVQFLVNIVKSAFAAIAYYYRKERGL